MLLAIDTATRTISIALYDGVQIWAEQTWQSHRQHTVELMPNITRQMALCHISSSDLSGIAVSIGPGSFSGMRVGLATAKAFCYAKDIPLVGISSLEVAAYPHAYRRIPICAVARAGRKRFCIALYRLYRGNWKRLDDFQLVNQEDLIAALPRRAFICGEITPELADSLTRKLGDKITIASPAQTIRRAGYLAELGWERLSADDTDELASLEPIYLS